MKRIYLSHPYVGKRENRERARAIAAMYADIWRHERRECVIINPLDLLAGCAGYLPEDAILGAAIELMKWCDAVIFCPGWQDSPGCKAERLAADGLGMEVAELDADAEEIAVRWYGKHRMITKRRMAG